MGDPFTTTIFVVSSLIAAGQLIYSLVAGGTKVYGPRLKDKDNQVSTYGIPIPIIYVTVRMAGNVIWAGPWIEVAITETVGKGGKGSSSTRYEYKRSFAVAFCEGEVDALLKLWCDHKLVYNATGDNEKLAKEKGMGGGFKFYTGSETQLPDPVVEAQKGSGNVPAYRGTSYVVFNKLNLSRYGNRIPNVRALLGKATQVSVEALKDVPGWWGDGNNQGRWYSLQILMSEDESYIITCFPGTDPIDWDTWGTWFQKISTITGQLISQKWFDSSIIADCEIFCEGINCSPDPTGYDPFGWHHPACVDELGRVYAASCDGYGRFYRLNSDTWTIEANSPIHWSENIEEKTGLSPLNYSFWTMNSIVSHNPLYPYVWFKSCSEEQRWAPGVHHVSLVNRETMANPFDSGDWAYVFCSPNGFDGYVGSAAYTAPVAFCLNNLDASCFVLWADIGNFTGMYLSHLYPDGRRLDVNVTAYMPSNTDDWHTLWAHMAYDSDSDQIVICGNDGLATYAWFFNGDLTYSAKVELPGYIPWLTGSCSEDNFQRGVANGKLYVTGWYDDPITIYEIDVASQTISVIYEQSLAGIGAESLIGAVYCTYKDSVFIEIEMTEPGSDTFLKEIVLNRYDPDTVLLRDIVSDICVRCTLATNDIDASPLTQTVDGFLVNQLNTGTETIRPLGKAYFFDGVEVDDSLSFVRRGGPSLATIDEDELSVHVDGEERPTPLKQIIKQETDLPTEIDVQYFDVDRKQETNTQIAQRILVNTENRQSFAIPTVMNKDKAAQIAEIALNMSWTGRTTFEFCLGIKYLHLVPTDVITIEKSEATYQMMLTGVSVEGGVLKFEAVQDYESQYVSTASGTSGIPIDEEIDFPGPAIWYLLDTSPLTDSEGGSGGLYSVVNGYTDYFSGANIFMFDSITNNWSLFSSPSARAITGKSTTALPKFNHNIFDEGNTVTVRLDYEDHYLTSVTEAEVLQGYNAAILGNELFQFQNVVDNGDQTYTLSKLLRGRKGTDWSTSHIAGETFVLLTQSTVFWTSMNDIYLEIEKTFRGVSFEESFSTGSNKLYTPYFRTLRPWGPVHVSLTTYGSDVNIDWIRRNRLQIEWLNYQDVPMSETTESYELDFYTGTTVSFTKSATTSSCTVSVASLSGIDSLVLYQMNNVVGRGFASSTISI